MSLSHIVERVFLFNKMSYSVYKFITAYKMKKLGEKVEEIAELRRLDEIKIRILGKKLCELQIANLELEEKCRLETVKRENSEKLVVEKMALAREANNQLQAIITHVEGMKLQFKRQSGKKKGRKNV